MNNKGNSLTFLVVLILALVAISCCTSAPSPTQTPAPAPTTTNTPAPLPLAETLTPTVSPFVQINIINDTDDLVCDFFITYWGHEGENPNLIAPPMLPGGTATIEHDPGMYNIEVWDCQMNMLHDVRDFELDEALT